MTPARPAALLMLVCVVLTTIAPAGRRVSVRHRDGALHGFLVGRAMDGRRLAAGDLVQTVDGARVTDDLTFSFLDGSRQRETVVFEERGRFRLVSDHLTQRGPAFPQSIDWTFDAASGIARLTATHGHGATTSTEKHVDAGPDLANGIVPMLLQHVTPADLPLKVPMLAATPDARRVMLEISADGKERCVIGGLPRTTTRYRIHVSVGGLAGVLAPLVGMQPPDSRVWILEDAVPVFVKSEAPLYPGGPMWRIELASPTWPGDR